MSILVLGHGEPTKNQLCSLRGDIGATTKFLHLLNLGNYPAHSLDILELFNQSSSLYYSLSSLNYELALSGHGLIEESHFPEIKTVLNRLLSTDCQHVIVFSWLASLMAVLGTGVHKQKALISKAFTLQENETIHPNLYNKCDLLITESLLTNKKIIESGIPPWKTLLLPHFAFIEEKEPLPSRDYAEKVAFKKKPFTPETLILGTVCRVEAGKNCEFILEAVKKLTDEGYPLLFILKGGLENHSNAPIYRDWLANLLESLQEESWFIWDPDPTPIHEIHTIYASFDIFIHLSGSEGGSNAIVEALSQGLPSLILDASTNPSLFKNGAYFVKNAGFSHPNFFPSFLLPDREDLYEKLKNLVTDAALRKHWSECGRRISAERFSKKEGLQRIPLMLKASQLYHSNTGCDSIKKEVEERYVQDCALFGI